MIPAHGHIVVGFDGSPASLAAARAAAAEARAHDGEVRLVAAVPRRPRGRGGPTRRAAADAVRHAADELWTGLRAEHVEIALWLDVHAGPPHRILVEAARGADLIVVGRRGGRSGGGRAWRAGGSTGARVARRASCPVVVVPDAPSVAAATPARSLVAAGPVPTAAA